MQAQLLPSVSSSLTRELNGLLFCICLAWGCGESFSVPSNGVQVGTSELYILGGTIAQLPTPSTSDTAPKILNVTAKRTGTFTFAISFDVEGDGDIGFAYFDFGGDGIYKAEVAEEILANDKLPTACGVGAAAAGVTCTPACISACACLSCSDSQFEANSKESCAFTCSANDKAGVVDRPPYNGSEKAFASLLYNGSPEDGIPGLVASVPNCNASTCEAPRKRTKGWSVKFTTPTVPQVTPLFSSMVETNSGSDAPVASQASARATVAIGPCDRNAVCN